MKPNKLLRSVGDGKEKTGVRAANVFRLVAHSGKSNHLIRGIYAARYCAGHHDWRGNWHHAAGALDVPQE